jgi:DNA polymerase I-like protein with 3'-5' exonuclease and polymerase domains
MTKVAIWLMFEYIHLHDLSHKVKLVMQVHDQLTTRVTKEYAPEWSTLMHEMMLQAGKFTITTGLLGAETNTTDVWTK